MKTTTRVIASLVLAFGVTYASEVSPLCDSRIGIIYELGSVEVDGPASADLERQKWGAVSIWYPTFEHVADSRLSYQGGLLVPVLDEYLESGE